MQLIDYINSTNKPPQVQEYLIQEKSNIPVDKDLFQKLETSKNSKAKNSSKAGMRKIKNETQNQSNIKYIIAKQKEEKQICNATNQDFYRVKDLQEAKEFAIEFLKKNNLSMKSLKVELDSSRNIIIKFDICHINDISELKRLHVMNTRSFWHSVYEIKLSPLGIDQSEYKIWYEGIENYAPEGDYCLNEGKLSEISSLIGPFYPQEENYDV